MTYPANIRDDEKRFWDLAMGALPVDCDEADLIATAVVIDPVAWRHDGLIWKRFQSLGSAVRVVRWMAVKSRPAAAPTPQPTTRRSLLARFRRVAA